MNKKRQLIRLVLFVLIAMLALPGFLDRISAERANRGACLSLDYASIAMDFERSEIRECLLYAKNRGIKTVSIGMNEALSDEVLETVRGFDTALFIDEYKEGFPYDGLCRELYNNHALRHISICIDGFARSPMYESLMEFISDKDINFVFMENEAQSANEGGFPKFPYTKNASYMRCYNTIYSANDKIDPQHRFHQMLNSFKDRNTHFINIVPFKDEDADAYRNFYASIDASELFQKELESMGYPMSGYDISYSGYESKTDFNMALSAVLSVLLCYTVFELLARRSYLLADILAVASAIILALFAYLFTLLAQLVYPLMLAVSLSLFIITLIFLSAKVFRKYAFAWYTGLIFAVLVCAFSLSGYFLSSVLSGVEYYMYFYTFRGVKIALFIPIVYALFAYVLNFGIRRCDFRINAKTVSLAIVLLCICIAGIFLYLMRSGNSAISDAELMFRNAIDTLMGIRPRTKEFLIGYPALILFLWYFKYTRMEIFALVLSVGMAILVGSLINSFCHVFTPCISIYQRSFNGLILGLPIGFAVLAVNIGLYRILKK